MEIKTNFQPLYKIRLAKHLYTYTLKDLKKYILEP